MKKTRNYHIFNIEIKIIYMFGQCLKNYLWMVLNGLKIYQVLIKRLIKIYKACKKL